MNVGELKKMLEGVPDDTPVVTINGVGGGEDYDEEAMGVKHKVWRGKYKGSRVFGSYVTVFSLGGEPDDFGR